MRNYSIQQYRRYIHKNCSVDITSSCNAPPAGAYICQYKDRNNELMVRDWVSALKTRRVMMRRVTTLGLGERLERVLAYAFFWVSGIVLLLFEKNRNVRWHALQSII